MGDKSRFSQRVENIKNCFEIGAIFFTGIWALFTFILKDSASLDADILQTSELLTNDWATENEYSMNYTLKIENLGNYPFYVDEVEISYWIFDNKQIDSEVYNNYLLVEKLPRTGTLLFTEKDKDNIFLINTYGAKQDHSNSFTFNFKDMKNKSIVFSAHSKGHYLNYARNRVSCNAYCNEWKYDCWNRTLQYRKDPKSSVD